MATLLQEKLELPDVSEVHWSSSTIMAIFLAASMVSAVFFGLGYSFGRGGSAKPAFNLLSQPTTGAAAVSEHLSQLTIKTAPPPVPIMSKASPLQGMVAPTKASPQQARPPFQQSSKESGTYAALASGENNEPAAVPAQEHIAVRKVDAKAATAAHYMVQVGAVGDRKDARTLVSQLRKHGFHAGIYSTKRDKFLHVQIGPFANVRQAQTMRHHVMADGYRAILKHDS